MSAEIEARLKHVRSELEACADLVGQIIEEPVRTLAPGAELVGSHEIQTITGIPRSTLRSMKGRGAMPRPIAELASGSVWLASDIEQWWKARVSMAAVNGGMA